MTPATHAVAPVSGINQTLEKCITMIELIEQLRSRNDCQVLPPAGIPSVGLPLPTDVVEFYQLCGGANLFSGANYAITLVSPDGFERANPLIVGEDESEDISHDWFVIAKSGDQYITIDLRVYPKSGKSVNLLWCLSLA
ncbi:MAG: SMI1/KNR4 family protein [Planctomycetaceae bacterium]|nr:SMI1/KNR4 family protein [Planctomycetaceae bacterium]